MIRRPHLNGDKKRIARPDEPSPGRKIYMAGKISKGDWRTEYIGRRVGGDMYGQLLDDDKMEWWPVSFGRHEYTGPFFVGCDHGCYHGPNTHGTGAGYECCGGPGAQQEHVLSECLLAIHRADTFFAWIDADDCYGTLVEIGYADLICKDIWIAGPEHNPDMWFAYGMATDTCFDYDNPHEALGYLLSKHDPVDYKTYIRSPEWREKAEAAKERAGYRCQVCNRPREEVTLDAHHRTYERLGHEYKSDITVLCRDCHSKFHGKDGE